MKLSKLVLMIFSCFIIGYANALENSVDWYKLNLTDNQKAKLNGIDTTWRQSTKLRCQRISQNKKQLKSAILNHKTSNQNIRALYVQVIHDESVLKDRAIECFLKKRSLLDTKQLKSLNKY